MLKRLRIKFVAINMLIVLVMLGIIFGLVLHSTRLTLERDSIRMLQSAAVGEAVRRNAIKPSGRTPILPPPYFMVELRRDGSIAFTDGYYDDTGSGAYLLGLLETVGDLDAEQGVLEDFGLRYLRHNTPKGTRIVFTDITVEQETMRYLLRNCLMIGFVSAVVFFMISLLLARWAVKPVDRAWKQQK